MTPTTETDHEVRDLRGGNWFWMHNIVLDKFRLSPTEFAVYACICRSASNRGQRSVIKVSDITELFDVHRSTVYRAMVKLKAFGLISTEKRKDKNGGSAPSALILLTPTEDPPRVSHKRDTRGCRTHATGVSHPCDTPPQQMPKNKANFAENSSLKLNIQDSVCTQASLATPTTEEFIARALEDPEKPLTDQAVQLIGKGISNARKRAINTGDVRDAIEHIRAASVRLGAAAACWKNQEVRDAVKERLAAGEDGIILATRFEAFIQEGRRKIGPGAWKFVNSDWMVTILTNVRASGVIEEAPPVVATEDDLAIANSNPPSPVEDPVGLARWMRAVANAFYAGNTGEAQNHYDRLIEQAAIKE